MMPRRYTPTLDVLRKRLAAWRRYRGPLDARPSIEAIERAIREREQHERINRDA